MWTIPLGLNIPNTNQSGSTKWTFLQTKPGQGTCFPYYICRPFSGQPIGSKLSVIFQGHTGNCGQIIWDLMDLFPNVTHGAFCSNFTSHCAGAFCRPAAFCSLHTRAFWVTWWGGSTFISFHVPWGQGWFRFCFPGVFHLCVHSCAFCRQPWWASCAFFRQPCACSRQPWRCRPFRQQLWSCAFCRQTFTNTLLGFLPGSWVELFQVIQQVVHHVAYYHCTAWPLISRTYSARWHFHSCGRWWVAWAFNIHWAAAAAAIAAVVTRGTGSSITGWWGLFQAIPWRGLWWFWWLGWCIPGPWLVGLLHHKVFHKPSYSIFKLLDTHACPIQPRRVLQAVAVAEFFHLSSHSTSETPGFIPSLLMLVIKQST